MECWYRSTLMTMGWMAVAVEARRPTAAAMVEDFIVFGLNSSKGNQRMRLLLNLLGM